MNLALFDFDGTITEKDSFYDFIGYLSRIHKSIIFKSIFFLPISLAYALRLIPMGKSKELFLTFYFKGWKKSYFDERAKDYANTLLPRLIRPIALEKIRKHKMNKDKIVVVSASLDSWIGEWCLKNGLDLISSSLETKNGFITGKLKRGDCNGMEKAVRIQEKYNLEEYETVFAYGDSSGDKEMLGLADIGYYCWEKTAN